MALTRMVICGPRGQTWTHRELQTGLRPRQFLRANKCACSPRRQCPTHNMPVIQCPFFQSLRRSLCLWRLILPPLLLATPAVHALDTNKGLSDLMHQVWSVDEGLPHSTVRAIAQTGDGYLWFATHEGVVRFDGVSFSVFNQEDAPALAGSGIASLLKAADGSLIIGLRDRGFVRFAGGKFETLDPKGILPAGAVGQ